MSQLPEHYGDVGPGWAAILTMLHAELLSVCPEYEVLQVKEKFGGLCAYLGFPEDVTPGIRRACYDLEHKYEAMSDRVCEECGKLGENKTPTPHGWYKTLCEEHRKR